MVEQEIYFSKRPRRFFNVLGLCFFTIISLLGGNFNSFGTVRGGSPDYMVTLDDTNTSLSLNSETFGSASDMVRYVYFDYSSAKTNTGYHAVFDVGGSILNNASTPITSMKTMVATFSGSEATLLTGITSSNLSSSQSMTSGLIIDFTNDPYFFSITNSGTTELSLTSLVITYSCSPTYSTITYESNRGTEVTPTTQTIGSAVTAPTAPTKEGFIFEGWFSDEALTTSYSFTTMPSLSITLYSKWSVDLSYVPVTIAEFKLSAPEVYSAVIGVVIWSHVGMELIVISDETGTLAVMSNEACQMGDSIRVGGKPMNMGGLIVLAAAASPKDAFLINYSSGNTIPLDPTIITPENFLLLDPDDMNNFFRYFSISGTLSVEEYTHTFYINDGSYAVPLEGTSEDSYFYLLGYVGFDVIVEGLTFPTMGDESALMLIFLGEDTISLDYTDEELTNFIATFIAGQLHEQSYSPGQVIELLSTLAVVTATITYETTGPNAGLLNVETGLISSEITIATDIGMIVHVSYGLFTADQSFSITVTP